MVSTTQQEKNQNQPVNYIRQNFTEEESLLIEKLSQQIKPKDADLIANLLEKNIGNMKFNKKLRDFLYSPKNLKKIDAAEVFTINLLSRYTYLTKEYNRLASINEKSEIAINLDSNDQKLDKSEKLSLNEFGLMAKFCQINEEFSPLGNENNTLLELIAKKSNNEKFKNFVSLINQAELNANILMDKFNNTEQYKSGDILMVKNDKTRAIKSRTNYTGHEGLLEEKLLSKYNHAGFLHNDGKDLYISDIMRSQRADYVDVDYIATADVFRIDPSKLVNKDMVSKLKQAYGEKWQETLQTRYEELSNALYMGSAANQIEILKERQEEIQNLIKEEVVDQQIDSLENISEFKQLIKEEAEVAEKLEKLEKVLIKNNFDTLSTSHWLKPSNLMTGHKSLFTRNDHRELSTQMFNASPEDKKMICSQYVSRCVAAAMDQLNRITALDLQAAGLISKEEEIIKNPISKKEKFERIHPERLVEILEDAKCIKKVENVGISQVVDTENVSYKSAEDVNVRLPRKIYQTLQNSQNESEFVKRSKLIIESYLKAQKVDELTIKNLNTQFLDKDLKELHSSYNKSPTTIMEKIQKVCIRTLEFCKLRNKDKGIKNIINKTLEKTRAGKEASFTDKIATENRGAQDRRGRA